MRALFIQGQQVNFAVFINIKEISLSKRSLISLSVDRGQVGHAGDLPGSAEKARILGGVFRVQPKRLDEIC